jgi:hypothetical protein
MGVSDPVDLGSAAARRLCKIAQGFNAGQLPLQLAGHRSTLFEARHDRAVIKNSRRRALVGGHRLYAND